jgi:hypothetical protein
VASANGFISGLSPAFYGVLMPKTAIACLVIAAAFGIGGWFYGL